jgi:hypothetical protein
VCTKNQENIDRLTALCLAGRENDRKVVKLFKEKNTAIVKKKTNTFFRWRAREAKKRLRCLIRIGALMRPARMKRLYLAAQENHAREYIRTLCTMLWTVVYMGICDTRQKNR